MRPGIHGSGMQRRAFLAALAAAPFGAGCGGDAERKGLRLSVTCDMFRGEDIRLPIDTVDGRDPRPEPRRKTTPADACKIIQEIGYEGVEMFDWRDSAELEAYAAATREFGLEVVAITANKGVRAPGCGLTDPAEREGFLAEIRRAIPVARGLSCRRLVVLTGFERQGIDRSEQMDSCVAGLRAAVPLLEDAGVTAIIEPINTLVTRPGYFLAGAREGFEMIRRVDSPRVKLLFDIYHVQVTDGNLILQIRQNLDWIGHFQIGDHPGRMQPGTGEIDYRNVFRAIYELQEQGLYDGFAALEYHPSVSLLQTLHDVLALATFD